MDTQQYINKKVELYDLLLIFIESSDDDDSDYRNLLDFFNKEEYQANKEPNRYCVQIKVPESKSVAR